MPAIRRPVAMHPNEKTVRDLYEALDRKDGAAMAACYAPEATFEDPAFGELRGSEVGGMWRMLTARASDLAVRVEFVRADDNSATAKWVADYTFTATGRKVRNVGLANMEMRDGVILRHVDSFPFWRWSRQALGAPGWFLGWTPLLRRKVRANARRQLDRFMAEGGGAAAPKAGRSARGKRGA